MTKFHLLQSPFFAQSDSLIFQATFLKVDKYFSIPGNITYQLDRRDGLGGGLLVNSSFPSTRLGISIGNTNAEIMGLQVTLDSMTLNIINMYSRVDVITSDSVFKDLSGLSVILDDFNLYHLDGETGIPLGIVLCL